jgi:hypothetical protein
MLMLSKGVTSRPTCRCSHCRSSTPHRQKKGAGTQAAAHLRGGLLRPGSPRSISQSIKTPREVHKNPPCITMGICNVGRYALSVKSGDAA